jgi:hypothetical protein
LLFANFSSQLSQRDEEREESKVKATNLKIDIITVDPLKLANHFTLIAFERYEKSTLFAVEKKRK